MPYNADIHHRHSIRLKDYDYSQTGAYFVTICAWQRECLFGEIVDGAMVLNDLGRIVAEEWQSTQTIRTNVVLDEFVVMPNHFHGIILITDDVGAHCMRPVSGLRQEPGVGDKLPDRKPGARQCAPTATTRWYWIDNCRFQVCSDQTHQHIPQQSRLPGLAAELL